MHIRSFCVAAALTVVSGTAHGKHDERVEASSTVHSGSVGPGTGHTHIQRLRTHREGTREVRRAIQWVVPHLHAQRVRQYSKLIYAKATKKGIDPLLVVALIFKESRFSRTCASKKNYGLMQVHVSVTTNPDLLGREHLLRIPRVNLHRGLRLLSFWKRYHDKTCTSNRHFWTSHYQHGCRVSDPGSGERVRKLYITLVEKFRKTPATI